MTLEVLKSDHYRPTHRLCSAHIFLFCTVYLTPSSPTGPSANPCPLVLFLVAYAPVLLPITSQLSLNLFVVFYQGFNVEEGLLCFERGPGGGREFYVIFTAKYYFDIPRRLEPIFLAEKCSQLICAVPRNTKHCTCHSPQG